MSHIEIIHLIDSYVLLATHIISLIIVCRKLIADLSTLLIPALSRLHCPSAE